MLLQGIHHLTQGPFSHITEAFYAMIGYNPDNRKLSEGTSVIEADDDTDLMNQIDQKMSTLHNPYATKYVGNWQKIHLMTLLEIEGEVSDFMGKALRKALYMKMKGKDINVDSGSDEELDEAASDIMNEQKKMAMFKQEQTRRQCCSKDHGSGEHKHSYEDKPQTSNHSTGDTNIQTKSSDSHTHELDQSTYNLDQSYEI